MQSPKFHNFPSPVRDKHVRIPLKKVVLEGRLAVPENALGLVIFAHGSGSSRFSSRNWYVAEFFHNQHIATLLTDLLTIEEEKIDLKTRHLRFDIPMLAERLVEIANWVKDEPGIKNLKIGHFGSSTGGGAALIAAAKIPENIDAVVSRGGRADLAGEYLSKVKAPTLLIVGERDTAVLDLNQQALVLLNKYSKITIVPGATHLFEEPGTLNIVAKKTMKWFKHYLE